MSGDATRYGADVTWVASQDIGHLTHGTKLSRAPLFAFPLTKENPVSQFFFPVLPVSFNTCL